MSEMVVVSESQAAHRVGTGAGGNDNLDKVPAAWRIGPLSTPPPQQQSPKTTPLIPVSRSSLFSRLPTNNPPPPPTSHYQPAGYNNNGPNQRQFSGPAPSRSRPDPRRYAPSHPYTRHGPPAQQQAKRRRGPRKRNDSSSNASSSHVALLIGDSNVKRVLNDPDALARLDTDRLRLMGSSGHTLHDIAQSLRTLPFPPPYEHIIVFGGTNEVMQRRPHSVPTGAKAVLDTLVDMGFTGVLTMALIPRYPEQLRAVNEANVLFSKAIDRYEPLQSSPFTINLLNCDEFDLIDSFDDSKHITPHTLITFLASLADQEVEDVVINVLKANA